MNSFLTKASRLSTRKRDLKMNRRDALIAEQLKNNREIMAVSEAAMAAAVTEVAEIEAAEIDGKQKESIRSPFFNKTPYKINEVNSFSKAE